METVEEVMNRRDAAVAEAESELEDALENVGAYDDIGLALEQARHAVRLLEKAARDQRKIDDGMAASE